MTNSSRLLAKLPVIAILILPSTPLRAVDFREDVRPILSKNCFKCHGGPRAKADFQMDRPEKLEDHIGPGKYIVPGDPSGSEVIKRVSMSPSDTNRMPPPRKGTPLTDGEINVLRTWIQKGAHLEPPEEGAETVMEKPDPEALHTWKSANGKSLQAYFVRLDGVNVVLRSEDGKEKPFPVKIFSDESKELIQALVQP